MNFKNKSKFNLQVNAVVSSQKDEELKEENINFISLYRFFLLAEYHKRCRKKERIRRKKNSSFPPAAALISGNSEILNSQRHKSEMKHEQRDIKRREKR
jgi:hypothetical protein